MSNFEQIDSAQAALISTAGPRTETQIIAYLPLGKVSPEITVADEKQSFSEGRSTIRIRLNSRILVYALAASLLLPPGLFAEGSTKSESRLLVPDGTAVALQLTQTVSSMHARAGDPLDFVVEKDVSVGDYTVIPKGSHVRGTVVQVKGRRLLGIGARITVGFDSAALVTGEVVALRARKVIKGSSHTWRMIAGMAVTSVFYLPAAPLFLLMRGGYSTALKGAEVTAHFDCGTSLLTAGLPTANHDPESLNDMIEYLPPRVTDREGREGDMVNVIFVAQTDELQRAFARAGWIKTDGWTPLMAWHLAQHGTHDAKLPMARFYLFGRVQDYSFSLPEAGAIVSRRHHIRIWKTGYTSAGVPTWAGAATFDDAITFARRGRIINHDIDPQVDIERDFIGADLATAGSPQIQYLQPAKPVFEAETVSGEAYHSDSRILMLDLHHGETVTAASQTRATGPEPTLSTATPAPATVLRSRLN